MNPLAVIALIIVAAIAVKVYLAMQAVATFLGVEFAVVRVMLTNLMLVAVPLGIGGYLLRWCALVFLPFAAWYVFVPALDEWAAQPWAARVCDDYLSNGMCPAWYGVTGWQIAIGIVLAGAGAAVIYYLCDRNR